MDNSKINISLNNGLLEKGLKLVSPANLINNIPYTTYEVEYEIPPHLKVNPSTVFSLIYRVHHSFSDNQVQIIHSAIKFLSQTTWIPMDDAQSGSCPRESNLPFYDQKFMEFIKNENQWGALNYAVYLAFRLIKNDSLEKSCSKRNLLIIDKFEKEPEGNKITLGTGELNAFNQLRCCNISLNGIVLGENSDYDNANAINIWASTILHECFHNFGWDHSKNYLDKEAIMIKYCMAVANLKPMEE
ncbi:hypothetical protein [Bacillus cereus group sp. RP43]|uniref:hypothetical protein n=1 Tax=Bacillus cereus group sp. RP43 TaxID=3040260 RepID=UPI00339495CA